jgi:two-component system LytT family sensor kinase
MSGATNKVRNIAFACLWSILLWVGFAPVMAGQEKARLLERGLYTAYWKLFLVNCAWCLTAALLAPPMVYLVRRYPIAKPVTVRRIAGYIFGSVPWVIFSVCIRWILLPAWNSVTQELAPRSLQALVGNTYLFANQIWDYLVIIVSAHAYEYSMRARSEELELKWEQALAASELQTLKSQLQPHFLFNTLQGIATLVDVDKARAKAIILKLSNLRRTALRYGNSDLVPLDEERKFIEAYLDSEKMDLEDRLEVRWDTQPGQGQLLVSQLILQPFVENAIAHGISCCGEGGRREIGLRSLNGHVDLCVRTGVNGKSDSSLRLGLQNTRARLRYSHADEAPFSFSVGDNKVATAMVLLPAFETCQPGRLREPDRCKVKVR